MPIAKIRRTPPTRRVCRGNERRMVRVVGDIVIFAMQRQGSRTRARNDDGLVARPISEKDATGFEWERATRFNFHRVESGGREPGQSCSLHVSWRSSG